MVIIILIQYKKAAVKKYVKKLFFLFFGGKQVAPLLAKALTGVHPSADIHDKALAIAKFVAAKPYEIPPPGRGWPTLDQVVSDFMFVCVCVRVCACLCACACVYACVHAYVCVLRLCL